jgi:hypothetical protein
MIIKTAATTPYVRSMLLLQQLSDKSKVVGAFFMDKLSATRKTEQSGGIFC